MIRRHAALEIGCQEGAFRAVIVVIGDRRAAVDAPVEVIPLRAGRPAVVGIRDTGLVGCRHKAFGAVSAVIRDAAAQVGIVGGALRAVAIVWLTVEVGCSKIGAGRAVVGARVALALTGGGIIRVSFIAVAVRVGDDHRARAGDHRRQAVGQVLLKIDWFNRFHQGCTPAAGCCSANRVGNAEYEFERRLRFHGRHHAVQALGIALHRLAIDRIAIKGHCVSRGDIHADREIELR